MNEVAKRRILVVDDEPFIVRSLTYILEKEGFEVQEARDGEEGLEAIRTEEPDLVLLDIMMPKCDGFGVLKILREEGRLDSLRVILLTAKGQDSDRQEGMALGAHEYMTKPFSPIKVVQRVRELMASLTP